MKKKIVLIILIISIIIFAFLVTSYNSSISKSWPTTDGDISSGIIMDNSDVVITEQVLNIKFQNSNLHTINTTYKLKNTSNNPLDIQAKFLISNEHSYTAKVNINGKDIKYEIQRYQDKRQPKTDIFDWQSSIDKPLDFTNKLGDNGKYMEYFLINEDYLFKEKFTIGYDSTATIFCDAEGITKLNDAKVEIKDKACIIISDKPIDVPSDIIVFEKNINDIYEYFKNKSKYHSNEFNKYLHDVFMLNCKVEDFNQFPRNFINMNITRNYDENFSKVFTTIEYPITFNPNEEIIMNISYNGNTGNDYGNINAVSYGFSPSECWSQDMKLTINVEVVERYPKIANSSLPLKKKNYYTFVYETNTLPQDNLVLATSISNLKKWIDSTDLVIIFYGILFVYAILGIAYVPIEVISSAIRVRKQKNQQTNSSNENRGLDE